MLPALLQLELAVFNAGKLDVEMTRRVFAENGLQAACSLGLSLDADISSADKVSAVA